MDKCVNCIYFKKKTENTGHCHRYPDSNSLHCNNDFCGEFQELENLEGLSQFIEKFYKQEMIKSMMDIPTLDEMVYRFKLYKKLGKIKLT